jgi:multiple antibiotic resistance protein
MKVTHRNRHLVTALAVGFGYQLDASIASAAEVVASPMQVNLYPIAQIFMLLFLMLGPFKIIGPFAKITKGAGAAFTYRIAILSILYSSLALLVAAFLGESILSNYGIPLPVLALSGGIILFLVALQSVLQQFTPHSEVAAGTEPTPTMNMALMPLAFPTIVTPYGIAALVVFLALSPDLQTRLTVGAVVVAIMLLNLIVMILTRHIMPVLGVVLPILGAVLGVVQVALGLQIINRSLNALGIL